MRVERETKNTDGSITYAYDLKGNRSKVTDPDGVETSYGYDGLDRLVGVQYPGGKAELYRLDAEGNRLGERELANASLSGAQLVSYEPPAGATVVRDVTGTFNRADWLLSLSDQKDPTRDVTLGWTASGELSTKTTATVSRSLTWDGRGALVAVADNGTEVGRYDHDADGLRVKRKTATEDVEYVLDEAYVLQEADAAIQEHPSYRRYHDGAEPVLVVDGGKGRFIGTDALGSPTDLTGAIGQVESKRQYDAWGRYRNGTAPGAGEAKLGFTGHQFDPETGLIYARARYYDPEIGRFVSRDTYEGEIEEAPSLHRFNYGHSNPGTYIDKDGHAVNLAAAGICALIGGIGGCIAGAIDGGLSGCGTGALVGAGAGALAGLTFGASLAATATLGTGAEATGSVLVAGKLAGAVGGAAAGAGNVLAEGGTASQALEAAENGAFLGAVGGAVGSAVAPAVDGAVVRRTGSEVLGKDQWRPS